MYVFLASQEVPDRYYLYVIGARSLAGESGFTFAVNTVAAQYQGLNSGHRFSPYRSNNLMA